MGNANVGSLVFESTGAAHPVLSSILPRRRDMIGAVFFCYRMNKNARAFYPTDGAGEDCERYSAAAFIYPDHTQGCRQSGGKTKERGAFARRKPQSINAK